MFMTAYLRGYHALHDHPIIFDDPIAFELIPEQVRTALEQHLAKSSRGMADESPGINNDSEALRLGVQIMAGAILARARYAEDCLEEAVKQGVKQYVILGAGMDTFAFRRPDLKDIQVFEIDHPDTQDLKRLLLIKHNLETPANHHFIPVDFTRENLVSALKNASYDPRSLSFFSWLGVTHYLPEESIYSTLKDIASISAPGSQIVFDYWDISAFDPAKSSNRIKSIIESTKRIGEPVITGFDPATLSGELARLGFGLRENLSPDEIRRRYFEGRSDGYSASDHVNYARAVVAR